LNAQILEQDDLFSECHVAFEKLLSSLFQFRVAKAHRLLLKSHPAHNQDEKNSEAQQRKSQ